MHSGKANTLVMDVSHSTPYWKGAEDSWWCINSSLAITLALDDFATEHSKESTQASTDQILSRPVQKPVKLRSCCIFGIHPPKRC